MSDTWRTSGPLCEEDPEDPGFCAYHRMVHAVHIGNKVIVDGDLGIVTSVRHMSGTCVVQFGDTTTTTVETDSIETTWEAS